MGPTRRGDANNARGTPYDRPSGSTQNPASARDRDLVRLGESSQPSHRPKSTQADDAERRSSWSSWVYTPLKALKVMKVENPGHQDFWAVLHYKIQRIMMIDMKLQESYNYLSKSPIKTDEVDENVGGALRGAPLYVYCRLRFHYRLYKFSARKHNLCNLPLHGPGHHVNQTASSTAAALVEEGEVGAMPGCRCFRNMFTIVFPLIHNWQRYHYYLWPAGPVSEGG